MENKIEKKLVVKEEIFLNDNLKVIAYNGYYLDKSTDPMDCENVVCIDNDGNRVWKINGLEEFEHWDGSETFIGIGLEKDGTLIAVTGYGFVFAVDIKTGQATFLRWAK